MLARFILAVCMECRVVLFLSFLSLSIHEFVLAIHVVYPDPLQQEFNNILSDMKKLPDESTLISRIHQLTLMIKEHNDRWKSNDSDRIKMEMENLKEKHQAIQISLSNIQWHTTENVSNLQTQLQSLFHTLTSILRFQYDKIVQLESAVATLNASRKTTEDDLASLKKKMKLNEKQKLIGDLLSPLSIVGQRLFYINLLAFFSRNFTIISKH